MNELPQKLGLSEKQAKIYLAVLESGTSSMTQIAQKTKLKRSTCYLVVEELIVQGLLSQNLRGKRKFYTATHPRRLRDIARTREREIEEVFPKLLSLHNTPKDRPKIHTIEYSYTEGVRQLYDEIYRSLKAGEEALVFTDIRAFRSFPASIKLYKKMLKQLKNPHIRELVPADKEGIKWLKEMKPYIGKNHRMRILPPGFPFEGTDNLIFRDKIVISSLQKEIFIIVIESKNIANTYRAFFECAWKMASKQIP